PVHGASWISRQPPIIDPVVAAEEAFFADSGERDVAQTGGRPTQMIQRGIDPGATLNVGGARTALLFVVPHGDRELCGRLPNASGQHGGVFDGHGRALGQKRQHRMGSVSEKRDRPTTPSDQWRAVEQCPFQPSIGDCKERSRHRRPASLNEMRAYLLRSALYAPARLLPRGFGDSDDVDGTARVDRIVHEVTISTEPEVHDRLAEVRRHSVGGNGRPPGDAFAKTWGHGVAKPRAYA